MVSEARKRLRTWIDACFWGPDGKDYSRIIQVLKADKELPSAFELALLQENLSDPDVVELDVLFEYIRREYVLDDHEDDELLSVLLTLCHALLNKVQPEEKSFSLLINQFYDIWYHQVDAVSKPNELSYFELTLAMLHDKYHALLERREGRFEVLFQFVLMNAYWFEQRVDQFLALWPQLQFHLDWWGRDHHLCKDWIDAHQRIIEG